MRPEVAEQFELTSGVTSVHVIQLGRDYDLTRITVAQAEQLVAAGCTRIRRKPQPPRSEAPDLTKVPVNDAGPAVVAAGPAKGKKPRSPSRRKPLA